MALSTRISGKPRTGGGFRYTFSGSHPGVTAICAQRGDDLNYAVICNRRGIGAADWNGDLRKVIDAALDQMTK